MYQLVYKFLAKKAIIYDLQFDFIQNFSTSYAVINLTENVR